MKTAIDIFCGAGGLSLGATMSGINTRIAIECEMHAAQTFKKNHKEAEVLNEDIRKINPLQYVNSQPFILIGGPPCQGFSQANTRTRNRKNEKNWMFKEYIRFLQALKPKWFLFENVQGFKLFEHGEFAKNVESIFHNYGYKTNSATLDASEFGVPQKRNRFFIVGNKNGVKFDFNLAKRKSTVTTGEALSDLPALSNGDNINKCDYTKEADTEYLRLMRANSKHATQNVVSKNNKHVLERYKYIEQGQNWQAIPKKLMRNYKKITSTHSGIYRRLDPKQPSVVIANYRKSMLIHPFDDRGLSIREAARLQSFPDDFEFCGPLSYQQQQIGNAVPPLLAKAIFDLILEYDSK
jgi:DNA (cytosine-5)-methyltransferase 1